MHRFMTMSDNPGFVLPCNAYGTKHSLFDSFRSNDGSFRIQRPGTYLISNLFRAEYMAKTTFVHDLKLTTLCRGKELFFTGERFDQWDLDVLLYCSLNNPIHNGQPGQFRFSPADLLRSFNLRSTPMNRQKVYDSLHRLHNAAVDIRGNGYQYMTRFINRVLVDTTKEECLVETNADVAMTFRDKDVSSEIGDRRALGRNGLAKWLHGATMVFRGGFISDTEHLYELCGQDTRQMRCFSNRLEKAVRLLKENSSIENWGMDNGQVRVVSRVMQVSGSACGVLRPDLWT